MQTQSINQHHTEDHQRLDGLFHEFQNLKVSDHRAAEKSFGEFKAGLERHIVWEEEILFLAFEQKFGHLQGGPTAVMRLEHREIRKYLDAIARKLAEHNVHPMTRRRDWAQRSLRTITKKKAYFTR